MLGRQDQIPAGGNQGSSVIPGWLVVLFTHWASGLEEKTKHSQVSYSSGGRNEGKKSMFSKWEMGRKKIVKL